mgnify:CR=1 FL=1
MRATKGRDNPREVAIRSQLHRAGLRFRLHRRLLPGSTRSVDIAIPRSRLAIFLDGCFWHCCPIHGTRPKENALWWEEKLEANCRRDEDTNRRLTELGWKVLRFWEHEAMSDVVSKILFEHREYTGGS